MKKSQILAALALAFALGVVAPVAGIATNASAYNVENGTATLSDVNAAIAYVENNAAFKAYVQIQNAIKTYNNNIAKYANLVDTNSDNIVDNAGSISSLLTTANGVNSAFGYDATFTAKLTADINGEPNFAKQIGIAIKAAKTSTLYNDLAAIIDIMATLPDNATNNIKLQNAVNQFRVDAGPDGLNTLSTNDYNNLHPYAATINGYKSDNKVQRIMPSAYAAADNIYKAIDTANEALAKYNAGYDLFMPLLTNSGLLDAAGQTYIETNNNIQPSNLHSLATSDIARNTDWAALYTKVQSVKNDRVQGESGDNWNLIFSLAEAWKKASGSEQKTSTVMATMVAYTAPSNTGDDQNDDNTTVRPGNTGIVAGAEGTASTTVSIVAGLATALTALGAGVVVYRNARRSSEN